MTYRERVLRTMRFDKPDRVPDWEFSTWGQTIDRWKQEGISHPFFSVRLISQALVLV